ncbi:hypothetical protein EKK58_10875 [Candidatus Dependentiae bacterium]|nr:MAG: hypothetical protein EKK58_10875 [Candidatus Dependentiae bacterium]
MKKLIMLVFLYVVPIILFGMEEDLPGLNNVLYYTMQGQPPELHIVLNKTDDQSQKDIYGSVIPVYGFFDTVDQNEIDPKTVVTINGINFVKMSGKPNSSVLKNITFDDFVYYVQMLQQTNMNITVPNVFNVNVAFSKALCEVLIENATALQNDSFKLRLKQVYNTISQDSRQNTLPIKKAAKNIATVSNAKHYVLYYQEKKTDKSQKYLCYIVVKKDKLNQQTAFDSTDYDNNLKSLVKANTCRLYYKDKNTSYYVCEVEPNIYRNQMIQKNILEFALLKANREKEIFQSDTKNFDHFRDITIWEKLHAALPLWFITGALRIDRIPLQHTEKTRYIFYYIDNNDNSKNIVLFKGKNGFNDFDYSAYEKIKTLNLTNGQCTGYYVDKHNVHYALCPVKPDIVKQTNYHLVSFNDLINVFQQYHTVTRLKAERYNPQFAKLLFAKSSSIPVKNILLHELEYAFNTLEYNNIDSGTAVDDNNVDAQMAKSERKNKYILHYIHKTNNGKSYNKIVLKKTNDFGRVNLLTEEEYQHLVKHNFIRDTCQQFYSDQNTIYYACRVNDQIFNASKEYELSIINNDISLFNATQKSDFSQDLVNFLQQSSVKFFVSNNFTKLSIANMKSNIDSVFSNSALQNKASQSAPGAAGQQPSQPNPVWAFFKFIWDWLASWF